MTAYAFSILLLRVVLGLTMAAHGYNKFFGGGRIPGTAAWFDSIGMKPGMLHARRKFGLNDRTLLQYIDVGTTSEQAFRDINAWLAQGGHPLSAYFADTDVTAAAAVRAFSAHGYRVPEDVSVIGFGDLPICTTICGCWP